MQAKSYSYHDYTYRRLFRHINSGFVCSQLDVERSHQAAFYPFIRYASHITLYTDDIKNPIDFTVHKTDKLYSLSIKWVLSKHNGDRTAAFFENIFLNRSSIVAAFEDENSFNIEKSLKRLFTLCESSSAQFELKEFNEKAYQGHLCLSLSFDTATTINREQLAINSFKSCLHAIAKTKKSISDIDSIIDCNASHFRMNSLVKDWRGGVNSITDEYLFRKAVAYIIRACGLLLLGYRSEAVQLESSFLNLPALRLPKNKAIVDLYLFKLIATKSESDLDRLLLDSTFQVDFCSFYEWRKLSLNPSYLYHPESQGEFIDIANYLRKQYYWNSKQPLSQGSTNNLFYKL